MGCRGEMREEASQDALNGRWDGMPEAYSGLWDEGAGPVHG